MVSFHSSRCSPYFDFAGASECSSIQPPREIQFGEKLAKDLQSASTYGTDYASVLGFGIASERDSVSRNPSIRDRDPAVGALAMVDRFRNRAVSGQLSDAHDLDPAAEWR